jgi:hypothetical protein
MSDSGDVVDVVVASPDESTRTYPALVSCENEESTTMHGVLPDSKATSLSNAELSVPIIGIVN